MAATAAAGSSQTPTASTTLPNEHHQSTAIQTVSGSDALERRLEADQPPERVFVLERGLTLGASGKPFAVNDATSHVLEVDTHADAIDLTWPNLHGFHVRLVVERMQSEQARAFAESMRSSDVRAVHIIRVSNKRITLECTVGGVAGGL